MLPTESVQHTDANGEERLISIAEYMAMTGESRTVAYERMAAGVAPTEAAPEAARLRTCPRCSQPSLIRQEGCDTCTNCGHSKCG